MADSVRVPDAACGVPAGGHGIEPSAPVALPELLAPAGTPDALRAAVAAGADAVYLGLGAFNARAANSGFALGELARGCALAHAHGARVYVTLNVYLRDCELDDAVTLARSALRAGADALIVADAGFARMLRRELPGAELHLSTQAGVQDAGAALLAARELGAQRVTCARELSMQELELLCAADVPVEVFCHGAICVCYSGACGFSALRRGRSANRGDCTQPCRMAYDLQNACGNSLARVEGDRLLCPRDYLSVHHVPELVAAGVAALKIEGRMKNPDYVFNVVRCYRAALDAVAAGEPLRVEALDELEAQLARSFNRGFTDAYLRGRSGAELMSFERSINQGLRVGWVVERRHEEVLIAFDRAVRAGDTLEIRSTPGPDAPADVPKRWPMVPCSVGAVAGERAEVHCKRKVEVGGAVHLVRSGAVLDEAAAAVAAMAAEEEHLAPEFPSAPPDFPSAGGKTGGEGVPALFRTESVSCAEGAISAVVIVAQTAKEAARLLAEHPDAEVAAPAYALLEEPDAWESLIGRLTVILDEANRTADIPRIHNLCERAAAVVCRNLGQIEIARVIGVPWEAAAPISVWNPQAALWLHSLGARRVWLPDELSIDDTCALARSVAGGVSLGVLGCSIPQLMVTEHCLLTAEGPCAGEDDPAACITCSRRLASQRDDRQLVELERAAGRLPVRVDALGRTRIFNDALLDRASEQRRMRNAGVASFLYDVSGASLLLTS